MQLRLLRVVTMISIFFDAVNVDTQACIFQNVLQNLGPLHITFKTENHVQRERFL